MKRLVYIGFCLTLFACQTFPAWDIQPLSLNICPRVDGASPGSARIGDTVIIQGLNFDLFQKSQYVGQITVNDEIAEVLEVEASEIGIIIPNLPGQNTFCIQMNIGDCVFENMIGRKEIRDFCLDPDAVFISQVNPPKARHGSTITISGGNFRAGQPERHQVFFNGVRIPLARISDVPDERTIVIELPRRTNTGPIPDLSGRVRVVVDGNEALGPEFEYEFTPRVSLVAGNPNDPNGPFASPIGIDVSPDGNFLVLADRVDHTVKRISINGALPTANIDVLAGKSGESGSNDNPSGSFARFNFPEDVAINANNEVFVADRFNFSIRVLEINNNRKVSTYIGNSNESVYQQGSRTTARLKDPVGIALKGDSLYIVDASEHRLIQYDPALNQVRSIGGNGSPGTRDGTPSSSQFSGPSGVFADEGSGRIFVADRANNQIRVVRVDSSNIALRIAGDPQGNPGTGSLFTQPLDVAYDGVGNIYVVDERNNKIKLVSLNGNVRDLAGTGDRAYEDGLGENAKFNRPAGICYHKESHTLYISDTGNKVIRRIVLE